MSNDKKERIKIIIAVVLVGTLAFALGYLIRGEIKKSPIIIESRQ